MNIRYFYVTEQVKNKAVHVTHCPTEEMVGDFFTKPLQGSLFIKMRNYIMGSEEPSYQALPRSVLRDHVTEFRQPLQVQSHLEMPRILVQLGHIQHT